MNQNELEISNTLALKQLEDTKISLWERLDCNRRNKLDHAIEQLRKAHLQCKAAESYTDSKDINNELINLKKKIVKKLSLARIKRNAYLYLNNDNFLIKRVLKIAIKRLLAGDREPLKGYLKKI